MTAESSAPANGATPILKDRSEKTAPSRARSEPQEVLPTDRVAFEKQLRFLLAYAAASDNGQKPVSNEDVAKLVEMNASTVSLANTFFLKMGFLTRSGREYLPSREVLEYKLAQEWDPEGSPQKLAPLVERAWFTQTLKPKLQMRPVDESEAIADLAQKAMVTPDYRPQLRTLINYMITTGLVRKEGDRLFWVRRPHEMPAPERTIDSPVERPSGPQIGPAQPAPPVAGSGQGSINFSVNISVNMTEMASWPADRIQAFFSGLAAVLAAKSGGKASE